MSLLDRAVRTRLLWPGLTEVTALLWCQGDLGPALSLLLWEGGRERLILIPRCCLIEINSVVFV